MPRAFLTPFVIAGLLFLPSCSKSSEKPVATDITECYKTLDTYQQLKKAADAAKNTDKYSYFYLLQQYFVLEKSTCFTDLQIAIAKAAIDIAKANPKR